MWGMLIYYYYFYVIFEDWDVRLFFRCVHTCMWSENIEFWTVLCHPFSCEWYHGTCCSEEQSFSLYVWLQIFQQFLAEIRFSNSGMMKNTRFCTICGKDISVWADIWFLIQEVCYWFFFCSLDKKLFSTYRHRLLRNSIGNCFPGTVITCWGIRSTDANFSYCVGWGWNIIWLFLSNIHKVD